jgi:hypothetical protein
MIHLCTDGTIYIEQWSDQWLRPTSSLPERKYIIFIRIQKRERVSNTVIDSNIRSQSRYDGGKFIN